MTSSAKRTRVLLVGFGAVNRAVLRLCLQRPSLEVVGVVVRTPEREGERASETVPSAADDLRLTTDLAAAISNTRPEIALVATQTRLADVLPVLEVIAASGTPAICTAEELAFVQPTDSREAAHLHDVIRRSGVAIVATGVNPGFVLDLWPIVLSGLAWNIQSIWARRVVDVSAFGPVVRAALGIGFVPGAFDSGVRDGAIVGHAGFRESLRAIAGRLGRPLDRIESAIDPIVLGRDVLLADGSILRAGRTGGAEQVARGWAGGAEPWIELVMTLHVDLGSLGLSPIDEVHVAGEHDLSVRIEPGCGPIRSTAALIVNGITTALAADPGLYSPGSLPPAAPWFGDLPPT